jgi:FKBP-type peptidyl-prolyl cis-trans isomerase SlyD
MDTTQECTVSIQSNKVAVIDYSLHTIEGDLIDDRKQFAYIHGHKKLLRGMEQSLEGKVVGENVVVTLAPADAYGELVEQEPIRVHQSQFGKDFARIQEGMPLQLENSNGEAVVVYVEKKEGAYAFLTQNHPLSGVPLTFTAIVTNIREASPDEIGNKMANDPQANNASSCSCC